MNHPFDWRSHGERRASERHVEEGPDPLRTYADLYHQAMECRRRVDLIRSTVLRASEALDKRPERFRFDGIEGVTMPRAVSEPFGPAAAWPTAERIQQVFADWHAAGARLSDAWEKLWPRDKELLARSSPESANVPKTGLSEAVRRARTIGRQSGSTA